MTTLTMSVKGGPHEPKPDDPAVPPSRFGRDHWSTFRYVECRCVDNGGIPDRRHMRTDPDRHPAHGQTEGDRKKYPTRIRDGELADHDDWDCVDDLEAAGLIEIGGTGVYPVWKMTEKGKEVDGLLRAHKADGKNFASFEWAG